MADLTPWNRELGTKQGRITPAAVAPQEGTKVFCLGWDLPGHNDELVFDDFAAIEQTATFDVSTRLLRITAIIRPPTVIPAGTKWVVDVLIDSVVVVSHLLAVGPTRRRNFSVNVSKFAAGDHAVMLRLRFASA